MREKITHTARVFDGNLIKLDVHKVKLPDGKHSKREIVQHPGAVAIVALDAKQQIFLVRQFRLAADKVMLEIPAGTLEPGETPEDCARRELQEEIGYSPKKLESLGGIYTAPGYTTEFIHLFLATGLKKSNLEGDADEFIEVVQMPFDEALQMVDAGEIVDSKTVAGLLRVARQLAVPSQKAAKKK
jgi:ADP-ribose pyrophosphatase